MKLDDKFERFNKIVYTLFGMAKKTRKEAQITYVRSGKGAIATGIKRVLRGSL